MVDRGPVLTSAIIFYLSIGAAIFHVLEEPNFQKAVTEYKNKKDNILEKYPCLSPEDLEQILEAVSDAAGQGVTITGNKTFNNWNWPNAVIFAATVITTIGYGNIAPKTSAGQMFCIFYGLFGVPLCLTWASALGKFFGGRAKRLGQFLTKRGVSLRKAQITCTAIFLIWGVVVHLVVPPCVFMVTEGWSYIEGLYFSFITITTIGFGDFVAGVNPNIDYNTLYRYFVEVWIFLGLAWLSLFFNWKVSMYIEVHKAIKKRRKRRKDDDSSYRKQQKISTTGTDDVKIFTFLSKKPEGYNDLIKQIGNKPLKNGGETIRNGTVTVKNDRLNNSSRGPVVMFTKTKEIKFSENKVPNRNEEEETKTLCDQDSVSHTQELSLENQLDKTKHCEAESWHCRTYNSPAFDRVNIMFANEADLLEYERNSRYSTDENVIEEPEAPETLSTSLEEIISSSGESTESLPYEQIIDYGKVNNV